MKAIVNTAPGKCEFLEWPSPEPGKGEVRIRTAVCGICSTELGMIKGWDRTPFPAIPGHEWSGVVESVGAQVDKSLIGKHCVGENVLSDGGEVGFEHPGGYGQYFITDANNLHIIPDDFPLHLAVLAEPIAVVVHGYHRLKIAHAEEVLIFGDGPIGLLMALYLKQAGIRRVKMAGGQPSRLGVGRYFGVDLTYQIPHPEGDFTGEIRQNLGEAFQYIVEASGSVRALETALNIARRKGRILVLGDYSMGRARFEWNHLLHNELELIGSNASAGAWKEAVDFLLMYRTELERIITHTVPAPHFDEGLELAKTKPNEAIKVVITWE
jgi:threonine dehydrogenase-like Zn-dependent dehydrogenase